MLMAVPSGDANWGVWGMLCEMNEAEECVLDDSMRYGVFLDCCGSFTKGCGPALRANEPRGTESMLAEELPAPTELDELAWKATLAC